MNDIDQQMVRALGHPLRVEILRHLEDGPSSPVRLSKRIGESLANVSYHTKVLLKYDCIELVGTAQKRGAVEHIYRLNPRTAIGSGAWKNVPPALRTHYAGSALASFATRAVEALDAGTVESRPGSGIAWLPLDVDEQGWKELRGLLDKCEKQFRTVADKSAERMRSPRDGFSIIVAIAAYESANRDDVDPRR